MAFHVADNATLKAENPPPPGTSPNNPRTLEVVLLADPNLGIQTSNS